MEKQIIKENHNKLVVKHNKLIEFKGRMTTSELKLFSLIIADVREHQEKQFEEYQVDISVLQETTKHRDFYSYIQDVALKLEDKRIVVNGLTKKNKRYFTTIRLINKPRYSEDNKNLVVDIDSDLIPYIIDLKREFTRYQIENILKLKSNYSIRIYELLKQYEKIGVRDINIKELREYLGIAECEYKRFYDFEKRTLKVAKKEINNYTDIDIDYIKIKKGRRILSISFTVKSKNNMNYINYLNENYNIKEFRLKSGLENENFNSQQIIELYEIAVDALSDNFEDMDDIFEYIKLTYNFMMDKKGIKNRFSYLKKALEEDYGVVRAQIKLNFKI